MERRTFRRYEVPVFCSVSQSKILPRRSKAARTGQSAAGTARARRADPKREQEAVEYVQAYLGQICPPI